MATKYVTLKDSNGDTLYPQAVATNIRTDGSYTLTNLPAHSYGTNTYTLQKLGNICIFSCAPIWQESAPQANTWYNIGTLPAELVPSVTQSGVGYLLNGSNGNMIAPSLFTVDASTGTIRGKPSATSTAGLTGWECAIVWVL